MFSGLFSRLTGRGGDHGSDEQHQPAFTEKPNRRKRWGSTKRGDNNGNAGEPVISEPIPSSFPLSLTGMDDHAGVWDPLPPSSSAPQLPYPQGISSAPGVPPRPGNLTWLNSDESLVEQLGRHDLMIAPPPAAFVKGSLAHSASSSSSLVLSEETQYPSTATHKFSPSDSSTFSGSSSSSTIAPNKWGLKLQTGTGSSSTVHSYGQDNLAHYSYPASTSRQKLSPIAELEYTSPESSRGPKGPPSDSSLVHAIVHPNSAGTPQSIFASHTAPGNPSPSPSSSHQSENTRQANSGLFITRVLNRTISQTSSKTQVSVNTTSSQTRINTSNNVSGSGSATPLASAVSGVNPSNEPVPSIPGLDSRSYYSVPQPSPSSGPQPRHQKRDSASSSASTATIAAPAGGSPVLPHQLPSNAPAAANAYGYHLYPHNYPYGTGMIAAMSSGPQLSTITDVTEGGYRGSMASAGSGGSGNFGDRKSGSGGDGRSGGSQIPSIVGGGSQRTTVSGSRKGSGDRTSGYVTGFDGDTGSLHADSFVTASDASLATGQGSRPRARMGTYSDPEPETPLEETNAGSTRSMKRVRIDEGLASNRTTLEIPEEEGEDNDEDADDRDQSPETDDDSPLQQYPIYFGNAEGDVVDLGYAFPMPPHRSFENLPQSIGHNRQPTMSSSTSTATPMSPAGRDHHHSSSSDTATTTTPRNFPSSPSSPIPIPTRNSQPTPEIILPTEEPPRSSGPGAILTDPITLSKGKQKEKEKNASAGRLRPSGSRLISPPSASESFISRRWNRDFSIPTTGRLTPSTFRIRKARPWVDTTPAFWAFWLGFVCPVLWLIGGWHFTNFGEQPPRLTFWEFYFNAGYWKDTFSTCCGIRKRSKEKDIEMVMPSEQLTLGGPALSLGGPIYEEPGEVEKVEPGAEDSKAKGKGKEIIQVKDVNGKRKTEDELPLPAWVAEKQKTPSRRARLYDPKRSLRGISFGYPFIARPIHLEEDYALDAEHWPHRAWKHLLTLLGQPNRLFDELYGVKLTNVRGKKECARRVFDPWIQRCRYAFCYALVLVCIGLLTATIYLIIFNTRQI